MPEGDTLYRTAVTLRKALLGREITRFETTLPTVAAVDARTPVAGRVVEAVESRGKHLLITLGIGCRVLGVRAAHGKSRATEDMGSSSSAQHPTPNTQHPRLVLHTHLGMPGSWHLYRPGEAWHKPARLARITLHTDEYVAPCFNAPTVELLTAKQAERLPGLTRLGPDAITGEFDPNEARARMRRRPDAAIAVALLDQRIIAGIGNVYKSEVLFTQGVSPFAKVRELSDETLDALIAEAHRLLLLNRSGGSRRTVFGLNERERLWVYGRSGAPCRRCGAAIRMRRQDADLRSTYFCPACQGVA